MEKMLRTPYSYHTPLVLNTEAEAYSVPLRTLMFIPTYLCAKCLNLEGLPKHDLDELSKPNIRLQVYVYVPLSTERVTGNDSLPVSRYRYDSHSSCSHVSSSNNGLDVVDPLTETRIVDARHHLFF